jgi:N-acetyl-anhydromuramyl-L-alanine amidase AmpD
MSSEGQFPGSIWMGHSQFWRGRGGYTVRFIIIHGTATPGIATAQGIGLLFQGRRGSVQGGTHYIVGLDGTVVQGCREEDSAWGNGIISNGHDPWWRGSNPNPNQISISIEHVKQSDDNHESLTPAQQEASFRLVDYLVRKWSTIPPRLADAGGGITGHYSIDPINRRYCPGPYPWVQLIQSLTKNTTQPVVPGSYDPLTSGAAPEGIVTVQPPAASVPSVGQTAHGWIAEFPGFGGIVYATDAAEQFQPFAAQGIGDAFGWLGSNAFVLVLRFALVLLGLALILGLFVALAHGNQWMRDAGGGTVPLVLGQA